MNAQTQPTGVAGTKLVMKLAEKQDLDPNQYASTVMKSCFDAKNETSPEQFMAFLMIAREHGLNPITREIYAFAKGGKVVPIVSIDGWLKLMNDHPQFNGMRFTDALDDEGHLVSITCHVYRKDREIATEVTEYLDECKMPTEPWKKWPARMLRHKATIQAARYAFGFSGIYDADEAQRIASTDIQGHAEVVDEAIESPAKRIAGRIRARVEKEDLAPPESTQEVAGIGAPTMEEFFPEEGDVNRVETITDDGEVITVDKIPGIKKASELSKEQAEFVGDMEESK